MILNGKLIWQKKKRSRKVGGEEEVGRGEGGESGKEGKGKANTGRRAHSHSFPKDDVVGKRSQQ